MSDTREYKLGRLAVLRRLYHHVDNGGTLATRDGVLLGIPCDSSVPTIKSRLETMISRLEEETHD